MATIQEQLENSVNKINQNAEKIHDFVNGDETKTIDSETGAKPSIAKIAKDAKNRVDGSIADLTEKANQVSLDKNEVSQIKSDINQLKSEVTTIARQSSVPIGMICWFPSTILPDGYFRCNNQVVTKDVYPELVKVLNNGDESAVSATLPTSKTSDGRGLFIRDIGENGIPLVISEDSLKAHNHIQGIPFSQNLSDNPAKYGYKRDGRTLRSTQYGSASKLNTYPYTSTEGADETRPTNITFVMCIKAFHGVVETENIDFIKFVNDLNKMKWSQQEISKREKIAGCIYNCHQVRSGDNGSIHSEVLYFHDTDAYKIKFNVGHPWSDLTVIFNDGEEKTFTSIADWELPEYREYNSDGFLFIDKNGVIHYWNNPQFIISKGKAPTIQEYADKYVLWFDPGANEFRTYNPNTLQWDVWLDVVPLGKYTYNKDRGFTMVTTFPINLLKGRHGVLLWSGDLFDGIITCNQTWQDFTELGFVSRQSSNYRFHPEECETTQRLNHCRHYNQQFTIHNWGTEGILITLNKSDYKTFPLTYTNLARCVLIYGYYDVNKGVTDVNTKTR